MRVAIAVAALALSAGAVLVADQASAAAPCTGQLHPNPSFERGTAGWTAGPRIVVLGDQARPAHTGRAYATFAGLDLDHTDLLRASVTVPAGCKLTVSFWARATSTATARGDYLNVGLYVDGTPPKTVFSFAFDHPQQWTEHSNSAAAAGTSRTATVSFAASETAGGGVTAFDVDDVRMQLS
ncbi:hypothetical protein [Actinoplanes sp. TFC3]|uniref:hypothetical protein n=1 Tax=Actinoplanes sp. TFC3 TaxID=1710355 RepID=UPI0008295D07|nr:hypothetical protein [Actinoplanes sp. TFC3]